MLLAVGGFNMLKLCHFTGVRHLVPGILFIFDTTVVFQWSYGNTKFNQPTVGSLYSIHWSQDGTQIAVGSGTGALIFAHIIEQEKTSKNLKAKTTGRKMIELQDIVSRTIDTLDFPERIIKWEIGYGHLVVATINQIHIYNEKYINTPLSIIDGRSDVKTLILGQKWVIPLTVILWWKLISQFLLVTAATRGRHFLVLDNAALSVFTYGGRLHLTPKYSGLSAQLNTLNERYISLGLRSIAIRDCSDESCMSFRQDWGSFLIIFRSDSYPYIWFDAGSDTTNWTDRLSDENYCATNRRQSRRKPKRPISDIHRWKPGYFLCCTENRCQFRDL